MYSDLISLADLSTEEIVSLLDLAVELKQRRAEGREQKVLDGQTIAMIFEKPSLRTRVSFETGIFQLGGHAVFLESKLGEREPVPDMARNLDRWVDAIVARTHDHEAVLDLAKYASVPVINALTDKLHPCQVLADAMTLREHKGAFDGLKVAFVGDGNNMFASWANFCTRIPIDLVLICPEGYELNNDVHEYASANALGEYEITNDLGEGIKNADVVYTDVWTSMGQEEEQNARLSAFTAYQVNSDVMANAKDDALFMHCLPAHRGEEVTDDVIESAQSVVFDEAENRMHAQKAVLIKLMKQD